MILMNDIQVMDMIESLKNQIADLAYQISWKEAQLKAKDKDIDDLKAELELYRKKMGDEPVAINEVR